MANQWLNCDLDDDSLQSLQAWRDELAAAEAEILTLQDTLKDQIADLERTSGVKAELLVPPTVDTAVNHRLKMTAAETGTDIHKYTVMLVNPGPNPLFDPLIFLFFPNLFLRIHPPQYGVVPTAPLDKACYDGNLIYIEVETDTLGNVVSNPGTLALALDNAGYDELFDSSTPDSFFTIIFFVLIEVHLPVIADATQYHFSGGKDTPLQDVTTNLNKFYAGTGKDNETVLEQLAIPVAKEDQRPCEVLAQTSNVVQLSSGALVEVDGDNLVELRQLWELLGEDEDAAEQVCDLLPGTSGDPIVVWMQTVTTTVELEECDGGGTQTTSEEQLLTVNKRPSDFTNTTPHVFWLEDIAPNVARLDTLGYLGLTDTQVQTALGEEEDTTYVIDQPTILSDLTLTCDDLLELFQLTNIEGVIALSMTDALDMLQDSPANIANGFVSAAWNFPGGKNINEALNPESAMADDIAALNETKCIDPFAKGAIASFLASVSAMIDMATRTIESIRNTVVGVLNKVTGILANIQDVLKNVEKLGCILPINFTASVKLPNISALEFSIELMIPVVDGIMETIQEIIEKIQKLLCQVQEAIRSLLGPLAGAADCLVPGLSNAIVNAFAKLLPNPLDLLPCIENPFDLIGMITEIQGSVNALFAMMTGMVNDIVAIAAQLQLSINIKDQTDFEDSAGGGCASGPLGAIVSSMKGKFGV